MTPEANSLHPSNALEGSPFMNKIALLLLAITLVTGLAAGQTPDCTDGGVLAVDATYHATGGDVGEHRTYHVPAAHGILAVEVTTAAGAATDVRITLGAPCVAPDDVRVLAQSPQMLIVAPAAGSIFVVVTAEDPNTALPPFFVTTQSATTPPPDEEVEPDLLTTPQSATTPPPDEEVEPDLLTTPQSTTPPPDEEVEPDLLTAPTNTVLDDLCTGAAVQALTVCAQPVAVGQETRGEIHGLTSFVFELRETATVEIDAATIDAAGDAVGVTLRTVDGLRLASAAGAGGAHLVKALPPGLYVVQLSASGRYVLGIDTK
jgi:hypothetical protein